jgi:dipeptidase E
MTCLMLSVLSQKDKMGTIVVIGGGELNEKETYSIDREIVRLTKKKKPRALFIPTASGEPAGYITTFNRIYGDALGCSTDTLYCLDNTTQSIVRDQILSSDLIYVGGGNTLRMMRRWRHLGIDKMLRKAHKNGTILSGLSAGGICWFDYGHSDSMKLYGNDPWEYIRVKGLGFIRGILCPHFNGTIAGEPRRTYFLKFMKKYTDMGIAIDNCAALVIQDTSIRILSTKKSAHGYKVWKESGTVHITKIPKKCLLVDLYKRHV